MNEPLDLTFFADYSATVATPHRTTLADLSTLILATTAAEKSLLPWLKLATFGDHATPRGSLRNNANVLAITGVEADYDGGELSVEDATLALDMYGLAALLYTSPSHTPEKPRWRVLCPTSRPLPPHDRAALVGRLNAVLGGVLSRESHTLSQAYYYGSVQDNPAHSCTLLPGQPIDTCQGLPEPVYPLRTTALALAHLPPITPGTPPDARAEQALAAAVAMFADPLIESRGRHPVLLAATGLVAPFVKAGLIDYQSTADELEAAMGASGRDPNFGEVAGALRGALDTCKAYVSPGTEFDALPALPEPPDDRPDDPAVTVIEITEEATARSLARDTHNRFVFDHSDRRWFIFEPGNGWTLDDTDKTLDFTRRYVDLAREQWGHKASEKAATMGFARAVRGGCECDPLLAVTRAVWDADPMVLGVPGGHVDLRTGELHPATASAFVRRRAAVAPAPMATPVWDLFLHQATGGDPEFIGWLQRLCGYALTGDVSEEMLAFVYGPGGNGKGVFLQTLSAILAEYAYQAPAELFKTDSRTNREYQVAQLDGARLVLVSETEAGSALAEAFVKELTGNEGQLNARNPYGRPFQFRSRAKLLIVGNHAPKLDGRSPAMERRLRVAPFNRTPPRADPTLKDRLRAEYPGILAWMIEGCIAWRADRLGLCKAVREASLAYFEEQDTATQWFTERCEVADGVRTRMSALLEDFNVWLKGRGERTMHARDFNEMWKQRGARHQSVKYQGNPCACDVALKSDFAALMS